MHRPNAAPWNGFPPGGAKRILKVGGTGLYSPRFGKRGAWSFQGLEKEAPDFPIPGKMSIRITELLKDRRWPLLSFEFFPPKDEQGFEALKKAAEQLRAAEPDFVTVTYGAGGSSRVRTLEICEFLRGAGFNPVMPHLTCVGHSRDALAEIADDIHDRGFRNVMALRGDPPKGETVFRPAPDGLRYASEVVALLKQRHPDFCCGVGGYPETHPEAASPEADIAHLKEKMDAGADFVVSQLFFDNRHFRDFVDRCRGANIQQPIIPGLLPATSLKQAERMAVRCNASIPKALVQRMTRAGCEGVCAEEAGVLWTVQQIEELLRYGVPGIHLYVLNRPRAALAPQMLDCFLRRRRLTNPAPGLK